MATISNIDTNYFSENDVRYVFLDGNLCKNLDQCYDTLQEQLSLPDYFGRNLDASEEVLSDLEWVGEKKIKIIILNEKQLLINDLKKKKAFLDILNESDNKRLEVIYLNKSNETLKQ
jgi:RNAse (barnase) inhibitor barstar